MTTIYYTDSIFWKKENPFLEATETELLARLEKKETTFEVLKHDDFQYKLYFDIDIDTIPVDEFDEDTCTIVEEAGEEIIKTCLNAVLDNVEPIISVATSHTDTYKDNKTKISVRYFVTNIKANKKQQLKFVKQMNKWCVAKKDDKKDKDFVFNYIPFTPKLFDEGIYDLNRKMRCLNSSKPKENRPLVILKGEAKDTIISAFFDDSVQELPDFALPTAVKQPKEKKAKTERKKKEKVDDDDSEGEDGESQGTANEEKLELWKNKCQTIKTLVGAILGEDPAYFDEYLKWTMLGYLIFNEVDGDITGATLFAELSQNFQSDSGDKQTESKVFAQYFKTQKNRKKDNKLHIPSLYNWLKELNPEHELLLVHVEKLISSGQLTEDEIRSSQSYKTYREEFEKTHFKLLYPLRYIKEDNDKKRGKSILFYNKLDYMELLRDKKDMPTYLVRGGLAPTPKKFYELWFDDEDKRKYGKIVFNPLPEPDDDSIEEPEYNSFGGFNNDDPNALEMKEEDSKYLKLLRLLMNDAKVYEYIKCWIASIIQRPNIKTKVCPILFSKTHGSGKNTIVEGMIKVFGKTNSGVVESIDDITKNFNAHLCNKLFIYGDEINANAKKVADKLKQVITRTEQNLEKKNQDAIKVDDFTNWLFTTNNENCFKIEEGCRRLMMIACLEAKQSKDFYQSVYDEIEDVDLIKQLFKFFKNYKQSEESIKLHGEFKIGNEAVFQTQYKKELLYENKPAYIQMFYKTPKQFTNKKFSSTALYEEAQQYAKTHYLSSNFTSQEFSKQLVKYVEEYKKKGNTGMVYIFPDRTTLLHRLFEVDEDYYRYVFQLDSDFTPEFKEQETIKSNGFYHDDNDE